MRACPRRAMIETRMESMSTFGHHCGPPAWSRELVDHRPTEASSSVASNHKQSSSLVAIIAPRGRAPLWQISHKSTPLAQKPSAQEYSRSGQKNLTRPKLEIIFPIGIFHTLCLKPPKKNTDRENNGRRQHSTPDRTTCASTSQRSGADSEGRSRNGWRRSPFPV